MKMKRKFKVGDKVKRKGNSYVYTVVHIYETPDLTATGRVIKPVITLDKKIGNSIHFWEVGGLYEFELAPRQKTVGFEITDD